MTRSSTLPNLIEQRNGTPQDTFRPFFLTSSTCSRVALFILWKSHTDKDSPVSFRHYLPMFLIMPLFSVPSQNLELVVSRTVNFISHSHYRSIMSTSSLLVFESSDLKLKKSIPWSDHLWVNYAIQLEVSFVLLIILLSQVLSRKRYSTIFILYSLLLILTVIRNVLQCFQLSSNFHHFSSNPPRADSINPTLWITINVLALLILLCIEASIYIHARAAYITLRKLHQQVLLGIPAFGTALGIGFHLAFYAKNFGNKTLAMKFSSFEWLLRTSNSIISINICWLCATVCVKLGLSIYFRWNHSLRRFGPTHIVVIMCCQTFINLGLLQTSWKS